MVVEDDPAIREVVQMLLEDEGYEVVTAANGAEAKDELDSVEPCVMLLDLTMPVMSGWELLRHLERDGRLDDGIHVVVVSASPNAQPLPAGPVAVLRKPVRAEDLLATVGRYC